MKKKKEKYAYKILNLFKIYIYIYMCAGVYLKAVFYLKLIWYMSFCLHLIKQTLCDAVEWIRKVPTLTKKITTK